jgi:hypothetical protein
MRRLREVLYQIRDDDSKWAEEITTGRQLTDVYHTDEVGYNCSLIQLLHSRLTPTQLGFLRQMWAAEALAGNTSSCFFVGYIAHYSVNEERIASYFLGKAAEEGHVLAMYFCGDVRRAADLGCPLAMAQMHTLDGLGPAIQNMWLVRAAHAGSIQAQIALKSIEFVFHRDYKIWSPAMIWYSTQRSDDHNIKRILERANLWPFAPYGWWEPERSYHNMFPCQVRRGIFTWLQIATRMRLCKDVRLLVCSYIATMGAHIITPPTGIY